MSVHAEPESKTLVSHLADLSRETTTLVRQEVELARRELEEKAHQAQRGAVKLATGGAVAYAGILLLLGAIVLLLGEWMELWIAAFLVGAAATSAGVMMLKKGQTDVKPENLRPDRTAQNVQHDVRLIKEQLR